MPEPVDLAAGRDAPPPALRCVDVHLRYESAPPTVILMIDRSGSMTSRFAGTQSRWDALGAALFDPNRGVIGRLEQRARFGVTFFTGQAGGICPMLKHHGADLGNARDLALFYAGERPLAPAGDTPTGDSLDVIARELASDLVPGSKSILLVTDGEPDTCEQPNPQEGQGEAIQAAQRAFSMGIRVFVLGVSRDIAREHLQHMANAGAGRPLAAQWGRDPEAARPYQATEDPAELAGQLASILLGAVRSCVVPLDPDHDLRRIDEAVVTLDEMRLERDHGDGWRLSPDTPAIELLGSACELVRASARELRVQVPCDRSALPR